MNIQLPKLSQVTLGMALFMAGVGSVNAADVIGGAGTLNINGSITGATCTAAMDKTSVAFPRKDFSDLAGSQWDTLHNEDLNLIFSNCTGGAQITIQRDVEPPAGLTGNALIRSGGFNYSGGVSTDSTNGPLLYQVRPTGQPGLSIDGSQNALTIPGDGVVPLQIVLQRSGSSAGSVADYGGTYSGSFTYSIDYP